MAVSGNAMEKLAIIEAVQGCRARQLEGLLDLAEDINCVLDESGNTALHLTSLKRERLHCAEILVKWNANLEVKNLEGQTPLHLACASGNLDFVNFLVSNNVTFNLNSKDNKGNTALHICVIGKNETILDVLLKAGANVNEVNNDGNTALHCAVTFWPQPDTMNVFQRVLDSNIDINLQNIAGMTAFHLALNHRNLEYTFILLERTSHVTMYASTLGNTLIHAVIMSRDKDKLQTIIEKSPKLLFSKNKNRLTPLHYALATAYDEGVQLFLMKEIEDFPDNCSSKLLLNAILKKDELSFKTILCNSGTNHMDSQGRNPLHWAILVGFLSGIDMLLSNGVDVNEQDNLGISPLHLAALSINEEILTKLLPYVADVNIKDENKRTPLHFASLKRNQFTKYSFNSTIPQLVKAGCLLDLQDCDGNTPLNLAQQNDHSVAVCAFLIWGANTEIADNAGDFCYTYDHSRRMFTKIKNYAMNSTIPMCLHVSKVTEAKLENYNGFHFSEFSNAINRWKVGTFFDNSSYMYKERRRNELNEIAGLRIGRFCLNDVFTMKTRSFIFDNELKSTILSASFEEKYPEYGAMLRAKFIKSELRYRRLCEAVLFPLALTSNGKKITLLDELKWTIFSFLPDEDLVSIIKAT